MADNQTGAPIYDELVRKHGDVIAASQTAERKAQSELDEVLRDFSTVGGNRRPNWFD
ncbi:hypothetical protein AB0M29_36435 [Streptomyces sp. NPDC051976]|uniref:hypothetical protein n=1 Tax=Streptomyces sp. NPDC051976 TaxID=3154947 RepID=UPI003441F4A3